MTAALILVILVSSGEADSAASKSMVRATSDALGLDAQVSVHEIDANAGDDDVLVAGKTWHADAVVRVKWEDGHRHATLHLHADKGGRWIDRELGFNASDAEDERGRTVGFAVISMLPEGQVPRAAPPPPPQEKPKKRPDPDASDRDGDSDRNGRDEPPEEPEPPRRWHGTIDLTGVGAAGVGGDATSVGGAARGQWLATPDFGVRVGGGVRAGSVSAVSATSLTWYFAGGVSWHPTTPSRRHPFGIGGSIDAIAMHYALARTGPGGVSESQGRFIPAADLTLEGVWFFTEYVGALVSIGGEMTFGKTDVFVGGQPVATIPALRGVAEAGLRARF